MGRASCTSGVRLRFETDASLLTLRFQPLPDPGSAIPDRHSFDAVIDGHIVQVVRCGGGAREAVFDAIGDGLRTIELWLPPSCPVTITELQLSAGATVRPVPDPRPLWVTWGSSLTHCVRAGSAARTWPAIVARRHGLNLINLGFGGECCLDPAVAMIIRDLPAKYISMKLGINTINRGMAERLYLSLAAAAVSLVREKHPDTPLALISPIAYPPHETEPNVNGYTMSAMRRDMAIVHDRFAEAGDRNLHYVDGLKLFNADEIARYSVDQCHPNAEGIDLMADHFEAHVLPCFRGSATRQA
jgi:lysophospholipase L1-like esterase